MKRILVTAAAGLLLFSAPAHAGGLAGAAAAGNALQYQQDYQAQAQRMDYCSQALQYAMHGGPPPPDACLEQRATQPAYVPVPTQPLHQPVRQSYCRWLGSTWTCY